MSENNNGSNNKQDDPTNNPLFGAPPPPSTSTSDIPPSQSTDSQAGPSTNNSFQATTDPLFGASPPQDGQLTKSIPTPTQYHQPIRRELRLHHPLRPASSSKTLLFIRRLTYILSILLGLSSAVAVIWSIFILPLLHSSFSARKALVDQQTERVNNLLEGIKKLRSLGIYTQSGSRGEEDEHAGRGNQREEASLKEISSSISSLRSENINNPEPNDEINEIIPITPLTRLTSKLKILSSSLDATSTTRLSVISTLEGYTSSIHHQLFLSRSTTGGMSSYGVNMNSLSNHLNQDKNQSRDMIGGTGEEWDNTRKEIRAIKGLLLNRRQFVAGK